MEKQTPSVTIVHVPREGYGQTRRSLESVLEHSRDVPHELLILDAASPPDLARHLSETASAAEHRELVRFEHIPTPNELRNEAVRRCDTRYLVFVDNDAIVSPGWLAPLLRAAEEHEAWVVAPTVLIGEIDAGVIHLAGGDCRVTEKGEQRHYSYIEQHYCNERLEDVGDRLAPGPCTCVEFHCVLVRRDVFEKIGLLDERLMSFVECDDFCLKVTKAGGSIHFEPASVTTYLPPTGAMTREDLEFFLLRWSDEWNERSLEAFIETWKLTPEDPWIQHARAWPKLHRRYASSRLAWPLGRLAGIIQYRAWYALGDGLANWLERRVTREVVERRRAALRGRPT